MEYLLFVVVCIGGVGLGALPGISPTLAVALAIPFTFNLPPEVGLSVLGALYVSTIFGGAISSIIFAVPGAPANMATVFDGYPLAKQGKATFALVCSAGASLFGGVVGGIVVLCLLLFHFNLGGMVNYGTFVVVSALGLILAVFEDKRLSAGLISILLGVFASSIGYGSDGIARYSPTSDFFGGLPVVPVLVGVFVFPQVHSLLRRLVTRIDSVPGASVMSQVFDGNRAVINGVRHLIGGSLVGVLIGLLPGIGGQVSGVAAHSLSRSRLFKKKNESFFNGNPNGVIGVEAANNAMVGPSLIPLLTLGIPGSPTAAVIGGALLMYGVVPSPSVFVQSSSVLEWFIASLLVASIISFGVLLIGSTAFAKLATLQNVIIGALILTLSIYGLSLSTGSSFDLFVFASVGLMSLILKSVGFRPVLFILGFLLWPVIEQNWMLASSLNSDMELVSYLFFDKINWLFSILIVISVVFVARRATISVDVFDILLFFLLLIISIGVLFKYGVLNSIWLVCLMGIGFEFIRTSSITKLREFTPEFIATLSVFVVYFINSAFIVFPIVGWFVFSGRDNGFGALRFPVLVLLVLAALINLN